MKYIIDIKKLLLQANWEHEDFGTVANFFGKGRWTVTDEMLTPIEDLTSEIKKEI